MACSKLFGVFQRLHKTSDTLGRVDLASVRRVR
jgi:hypothetical protein